MQAGELGDDHELSAYAREYANMVIDGEEWALTPEDVDLTKITFETSTRMQRQNGLFSVDQAGNETIRVSEKTHNRAGFEAIRETIRHELVHAYQHQSANCKIDHGDSFTRWVDELDLSGRCSTHYEVRPEDYKYSFYCTGDCGFIGGRYRWSKAVRYAIDGYQVCAHCESTLRVESQDGILTEIPETTA